MKIKSIIAVVAMVIAMTNTQAQVANKLKIIIKNFESAEGILRVGLYNSKESYMNVSFKKSEIAVTNQESIELILDDLPKGKYAISIYHDSNANGELDKNFIGIPTEDYAFSNNADGRFGPPEYELCVFELSDGETTQVINLN